MGQPNCFQRHSRSFAGLTPVQHRLSRRAVFYTVVFLSQTMVPQALAGVGRDGIVPAHPRLISGLASGVSKMGRANIQHSTSNQRGAGMGADEHELRLRPGGTLSTSLNTWRGAKVFVPGNHLV